MAAATSSAATSGNEAAMVSAEGTTTAPGVIIAPRWMSSISLNRTSATLIATRSASASASLRKAMSARPSSVPQAAIQAPIVSAAWRRASASARPSGW
jgi:hypothetical protein